MSASSAQRNETLSSLRDGGVLEIIFFLLKGPFNAVLPLAGIPEGPSWVIPKPKTIKIIVL
jgi:hypothetical protein